jgi:hypothetical protein
MSTPEQIESQSKEMRYDVLSLPLGARNCPDIMESFKELKNIDSFQAYEGEMKPNGLNRNKLISFIILIYSHDSFLHQNPKYKLESFDRKLWIAADLVGFDKQKKRPGFLKQVEERLFACGDEQFLLMILEFLKFQSQPDWTEWCILNHELMENNQIRMAPIKEDKDKDQIAAQEKKAKFREQSESIRESIKNYEIKIFGDRDRIIQVKSSQKYLTIEKLVKKEMTFY